MGSLGRNLIKSLKEANDSYNNSSFYKKYKPLKRLWMMFWLSDYYEPIGKVITFYNIQNERIRRLWAYGKYLWAYGEWDSSYSLGLMELNLKRLQHIIKNGSSLVPRSRARRMSIAIECLKRMQDPFEYYYLPAKAAFDKKWGIKNDKYEFVPFIDENGRKYTTLVSSADKRRKQLKPKQQVLFDKEYKQVLFIEDKMFKRDMEIYCKIFSKDVRSWWD